MKLASRLALLFAVLPLLQAGGPSAWESNSWADFLKGRFTGMALTRDGRLTLAPKLEAVAATGEASVWNVVRATDGALWFTTGHRGRLFRVAAQAKAQQVWTAHEPELFALTPAPKGAVFVAGSPGGQIWRVDAAGKAEEWFNTKSKYIWTLVTAADGTLFAGGGDDGRIWRVSAKGQGEVWYETGQSHVTTLSFDAAGALLAGSEPNGNLYRVTAKDRAVVILHSTLPEIRDVIALPDGSILAGALGGGLAQKQVQAAAAAAAAAGSTPQVTTTITVTADSSSQSGAGGVKPAQSAVDLKGASAKQQAEIATAPAAAALEIAGVEKAALYRIARDLTVETLWSSKEENLLSVAMHEGAPFVSTDLRGRVYSIVPNGKSALVAETGEGEATRLLDTPDGLLVATGTQAKLFALRRVAEATGSYESAVHDAGAVARWGRLEWRGELAGGRFAFRTRSGNSPRPDKTWSEWAAPTELASGAPDEGVSTGRVASPNSRYIQWKVEMQGAAPAAAGTDASIDAVSISYQPQNNRPTVRSITVTPQWIATQPKSGAGAGSQNTAAPTFSVTVTDSSDAGQALSTGTAVQQVNRGGVLQLLVSWQADDPDNDKLVYTLQVKGEGEREWKTLKRDLFDNTFLLDADALADGRYRFRVIASDRPSNPPSQARDADLESPPILLDQTPPKVTLAPPGRTTDGSAQFLELDVKAVDALSPLRRAEVSIDAGPWRPMECADGVADSLQERFTLRMPYPAPGEHLVTVRVYDASGNAGLARTVIR